MNLRGRVGAVIVAGGLACLGDALFLAGCSSQNAAPHNDAAATGGTTAAAGHGGTGGAGGAAGGTAGVGAGGARAGAGGGQGGGGGAGAAGGGGLVGTGGQAGGPPGYDPPQFPPLSAAPCPFAVAPASALCGGRANCPVVTDAEIADASAIFAAPAPNAGYAMYTMQSMPSTLCLLTLTSSGASHAVVDPFPVPANNGALLASDPAGSPHAFVATASSITHFHQSSGAGTWTSDTLDLAGQRLRTLAPVVSTDSGLAVLFTTHLPDPGSAYTEVVRLATGDGSGSWTYDVVFDAAGASEVWDPTVAVDRDGRPAVFFETAPADNAQSLYAWRTGGAAAPFTGPVASRLATFEAAATTTADAGPIVSEVDADGLHVWLFRGGALARDAGLAGAFAGEQLTGCGAVNSVEGTPNRGCQGSKDMACTLRGDGFYSYAHALGNTADGTTWAVYLVEHTDADVVLRESCTVGQDPSCSCSPQVVTDRTTADLFVARVPAADAAGGLDPRLRVRLGATINSETDGIASVVARGSLLYVVATTAAPVIGAPNRYLIIDTSRL